MTYRRVLLVDSGSGVSASVLREQLEQQGLDAEILVPERLPDYVREAVRTGHPPSVCVFQVGPIAPLALARELRLFLPGIQLMFVTAAGQQERLRRDLRNAPLIGGHASVFEHDAPGIAKHIALADNVIRRQRKLRTTLDRANQQIASAKPVDGVHLRRNLIAERYLHSFLEQADDAIIGLDNKAQVLYWNPRASTLFGLDPKEAVGLPLRQMPFWSPVVDEAVAQLRAGGNHANEEMPVTIRGQQYMLDIMFSPVLDESNYMIGTLLVARDASARHRTQDAERAASRAIVEQAEEDRRRLALLFESAPGFMAVTMGPEHVFQMANRAYLDTLGDRALLTRTVDNVFPDLANQAFRALRDRVFATGKPYVGRNFPVVLQRQDGGPVEQLYLDFVYQPIYDEDGRVTGIFCQGSDVTEQKLMHDRLLRHQNDLEQLVEERSGELQQTQLALQQSQKLEAIGKLTGGVAHDFNNILQVIGSNLELLALHKGNLAASESRIQSAIGAVARGARLASHLLAFARRQPLKPLATNVAKVMQEMDDLLRRAIGEAISIEMVLGGGLWSAMVDRNQLENVLLNLAINARDAMDGAGKLTIEVGNAMLDQHYVDQHADVAAGQYLMLAISDTGCGMTPEVLAHVYEPFYTTKKEGQGTGLGLSMAYGFVKQSGGHIKIYTEPGNGTTIKIYLPRSYQSEAVALPIRAEPAPRGSETVLVVEDDEAVQAVVVDQLTELGYRVLRASDAQAGLSVLQSGAAIDLLFTDVVMPGPLRSADLARQARQILPHIAVLFTSGYTQNAIVHGGRLDAGVELLSKPYRREDLARRVRHILDRRLSDTTGPARPVQLRVLVVEDDHDALETICEMLAMMGHDAQGVSKAEDALDMLNDIDVLITDIRLPGMSGPALARRALAGNPRQRIVFVSGGSLPTGLDYTAELLKKPFTYDDLVKVMAQD